jgi:hypothetical protein
MITRLVAPNGVGPARVGPAILEKVVHSGGALHQVPSGEGEGHRYGAERLGHCGPRRSSALLIFG